MWKKEWNELSGMLEVTIDARCFDNDDIDVFSVRFYVLPSLSVMTKQFYIGVLCDKLAQLRGFDYGYILNVRRVGLEVVNE